MIDITGKNVLETDNGTKNIWLTGIMGVVIGDALGMPVQFMKREDIKRDPITQMEGYGTYDMPKGTWSDDSSMALATLDSIREKQKIELSDIMMKFAKWLYEGEYTPFGEAFDEGNTCVYAISRFVKERDVYTCGKTGEYANGNGALMRIMPVCLYAYKKEKEHGVCEKQALEMVHLVSALTHNHLRSKMACGIYYFMIKAVLEGTGTLIKKLQEGVDNAVRFYYKDIENLEEMAYYKRILHLKEFAKVAEEEIKSSGYVVDSLEAAVWSLITTESFKDAALKAVNLGDDSDTIGAIACGLAVFHYGYEAIPAEWLAVIKKKEWIEELCSQVKV